MIALDDRVVLPHMAVPVTIKNEERRAALLAAGQAGGLVLLVPRIDGKFAAVGTVARVEETGRLPDGREASVVRGLYRGVLQGTPVERGGTSWEAVEPAPDPLLQELPAHALELAQEYRAI